MIAFNYLHSTKLLSIHMHFIQLSSACSALLHGTNALAGPLSATQLNPTAPTACPNAASCTLALYYSPHQRSIPLVHSPTTRTEFGSTESWRVELATRRIRRTHSQYTAGLSESTAISSRVAYFTNRRNSSLQV